MIKHLTEADFDAQVSTSGVVATFKQTNSIYSFYRLADPGDIARYGAISPQSVRHAGPTGDTGDYLDHEVERMAADVAVKKLAEG